MHGKPRKGQIVSRMEDDHITSTLYRLRRQQRVRCRRGGRSRRRKHRGIVVLKDEGLFVRVVLNTSGTFVSWAEITLRVVLGKVGRLWGFGLPLPRTLRAMRRDKDMLSGERVH